MVDHSTIFQALSTFAASLSIYKFISERLFKKPKNVPLCATGGQVLPFPVSLASTQ